MHSASIWILMKIQASFMLCVRYIFFFMCKYKYYSHDVDWMYPCDIETFDVFLCCCSTNERLGVSGFQGFRCWCAERGGEWQGSWIVMADSCSLTKRLSVSQQTGKAALPLCLHTHLHINTPIWKYTHICAILWGFGEQHEHHTDIHTVHIPFIWIPCACCRVEANHAFPSDSMSTVCYYLYAPTTPTGARPLLNMEKPSRCKFWMRSRVQKAQKITAKAEQVTFSTFYAVVMRNCVLPPESVSFILTT